MPNTTISAENLGPIANFEFTPRKHGVTVLVAPNGSGKSILLEAVQTAAIGKGKLPLRDRTKKGTFSAFGAVITIGGTCRHSGGFEVTNLEGRFDLAMLVDPGLVSPAAADNTRIKALVSLTGVEASVNLFKSHEAFVDFDNVVTTTAVETDDLVLMAAKIKKAYDDAALLKERFAENQTGQATALIPPADLDLEAESDAAVLQTAYNEARDYRTTLEEQERAAKQSSTSIAESQELLGRLNAIGLSKEHETLTNESRSASAAISLKSARITELEQEIRQLKTEITSCSNVVSSAELRLKQVAANIELVNAAKATIAKSVVAAPDPATVMEAIDALAAAERAVENGMKIRAALANQDKRNAHLQTAKEAKLRAIKYREAAKASDDVLSASIKCPQLRVESDGKAARLVTDTDRGKSIAYHDLSEGERWAVAIDIAADQVGEDGLVVISQVGWEGIDGRNRINIDHRATERKIFILTAEAAADPLANKEIKPLALAEAEAEQVRGAQVAAEMSRTGDYPESVVSQLDRVYRDTLKDLPEGSIPPHVMAATSPVTSPVNPPAKPPGKPPVKKPAPTPPPSDDIDEIPF